ncbi:MAG: aquaporin, partial [Gammaproteobacteria bacterium]
MLKALSRHWAEYLIEAAGLGLFMISACVFVAMLEHPASWFRHTVEEPLLRRLLIGVAMGLTAITIIYSPWGKRSGAHLNPAVTLTFFRLGKVQPWDALFYVLAQFAGGIAGVLLAGLLLGQPVLPLKHIVSGDSTLPALSHSSAFRRRSSSGLVPVPSIAEDSIRPRWRCGVRA